jgi:hypothetical protein
MAAAALPLAQMLRLAQARRNLPMAEIRETHTTIDRGGSGGDVGIGMVLGVILSLVVLVIAAWFFFGSSRGPTVEPARPSEGDANIQVNPSAQQAPAAPADQNQPATKAP